MNIMIEFAVPLNNGDAALIFSLGEKLEAYGHIVVYSTYNYEKVQKIYPDKKWSKTILANKYINKTPVIKSIYYLFRVLFSSIIREQDLIIAAPGGYINSYYGFKDKLFLLSLYKKVLKKPIIMFSQSVGPLSTKDGKILKKYLPYFSIFMVRDTISNLRIKDRKQDNNIIQTYDAAFLTKPLGYDFKRENKVVAISVREWKHDSREQTCYIHLIQSMIEELVRNNYTIVFLSTCQGDSNYVNDSIMAEKIYSQLSLDLKEKVEIDSHYYTLQELKNELKKYDFVVGTRLHMCILSWLEGVPAFNISYEEKGRECYNYLGLSKYSVDYNESNNTKDILYSFLAMSELEKIMHFNKINEVHDAVTAELNYVLKKSSL